MTLSLIHIYRHAPVIVGMDPHRDIGKTVPYFPGYPPDGIRKSAAVGVAQYQAGSAAPRGGLQRFYRIIGVGGVAVKKMFRVKENPFAFLGEETAGLFYHAQVFFQGST